MVKPSLIVRIQNYNRVSLGAILGATPKSTLEKFNVITWESTDPEPEELKNDSVLMVYSFMLPHTLEVENEVNSLKNKYSCIETVCGGSQPTSAPENILNSGCFDYILTGEGEEFFPLFLEKWLDKGIEKGIHHAPKGKVNLDLYPGFSELTKYLPPIEITRGCRCGCMFCGVPKLNAGTVRHRSLEAIVSIVKEYYRIQPSRRNIKFLAPNAFAYGSDNGKPNLEKLYSLLDTLKKMGIQKINLGCFPSEVRPDYVTREVMELVTPYLSNKTIVMGLQSGSDKMLKKMNRGHTAEQAVNAIALLREFGFLPHVDFIIGNPDETEEDQIELVEFMEKMINTYAIKVHMHTFTPLPATPWANKQQSPVCEEARKRIHILEKTGNLDGWWENHIGYFRTSVKA